MNEERDSQLMRRLSGELTLAEAEAFDRRLEHDPELAARFRELEATWRGLELPPPAAPAPGLATRLMAEARAIETARQESEWGRAPVWVRAASAVALAAGIVLGVGMTGFDALAPAPPAVQQTEMSTAGEDVGWSLDDSGLAELYLEAIEDAAWESAEESGS